MPNTSALTLTLSYKVIHKQSEELSGNLDFSKAEELQKEIETKLLEGMKQKGVVAIQLPTQDNDKRIVIDCSTLSNFSLSRTTN